MIPEINKVLYATDLSKNSVYAFYYAVDVAQKRNAKIIILHVMEPISPLIRGYIGEDKIVSIQHQNVEEAAKEIVSGLRIFARPLKKKSGRALNWYRIF